MSKNNKTISINNRKEQQADSEKKTQTIKLLKENNIVARLPNSFCLHWGEQTINVESTRSSTKYIPAPTGS